MAVIAGDYANEERNGRLLKTILLNASNDCEVRPRDAANMMQKAWNLLKERGLDVDESYLQAITSMYKLAARANIKPNKKWACGQNVGRLCVDVGEGIFTRGLGQRACHGCKNR